MGQQTWRERIGQVAPQDISLEKRDGTTRTAFRAYIVRNPDEIIIPYAFVGMPIAVGDTILRSTPAGQERLTVTDTGYQIAYNPEMSIGYPEHYAIRYVRESDRPSEANSAASVTYNLHGANSRVNIGSTDNSVNSVNASANSLFADMRKVILARVEVERERQPLLAAINTMEQTSGQPGFLRHYQDFMEAAANHMTILAPFLPALAKLLGG